MSYFEPTLQCSGACESGLFWTTKNITREDLPSNGCIPTMANDVYTTFKTTGDAAVVCATIIFIFGLA